MQVIIGIILIMVGIFFSFYFGHFAYLVQTKQREGLGPIAFLFPILYCGIVMLGFYLLGTSIVTAIAMGNLIGIVGYIGTTIYEMSKQPFIPLSKTAGSTKVKTIIEILLQLILISILLWLVVIIAITGYKFYFK